MPLRSWLARQLEGPEAPPGAVPEDEMYAKENAGAAVIIARGARREGVDTFDMRKGLRAGAKSMIYADGHVLYSDVNHVSQRGAELALKGFPIVPSPNSSEVPAYRDNHPSMNSLKFRKLTRRPEAQRGRGSP
jgi:hypothetical protein